MLVIPTLAVPNQALTVTLDSQQCQIDLSQNLYGLYLDLYMNNSLVVGGVLCENLNRAVRDAYFGFAGDICFLDIQGESPPYYTGLGTRFLLIYLTAADIAAGQATIG